ncbi:MAG: inositol monophosphatase [Candidatus Hydrogenedentes bacterium]|nr:inositol monophosphatase [Candidatus Hydrogenedentota bacterium]
MSEIDFIRDTLEGLAGYVRGRYAERGAVEVRSKTRATDLLTEVDLAVQRKTEALLAEAYPADPFVAEEGDRAKPPADPEGRCWIMDPIDGTQNFVRGLFPAFGIALAFAVGGRVQAGGVCLPVTGDLFLAERGAGAFRNGARLDVSGVTALDEAWIEVDLGGPPGRKRILRVAGPLIDAAGAVRCHCAAVIGLCSVACGDLDGYVHTGLNAWDYAAAQVIVEEAGGRTSQFDGRPLRLFGDNDGIVASNRTVHDAIIRSLAV